MRSALAQRQWAFKTVEALGIFLLAIAVRAGAIAATRHSWVLINDEADYWRLAHQIAAGHGFGISHFAPGGGPTAERPPAFPLLLAAIVFLAGPHVVIARLVEAILGAFSCVLVYVLARQVSGTRRVAVVAGALAAVLPPMVIASTSLMSEALLVPASLGVITAAMAYRRGGSVLWLPVCGLSLAIATLTRPVAAILLLPALLLVAGRKESPARFAGAVLAAAVLAIAPCLAWEIRDIDAFHSVIPLTTQSGYLLSGTYNATSAHDAQQPGVWMPANLDPATRRLIARHPHANELQMSNDLQRAALHYLAGHPSYGVTVVSHNLLRLFDLTNLRFDQDVVHGEFGYGSAEGTAEYLSALMTLALALLALVGLALRRWPRWPVPVALVPVLLVLVTLPVQSFSRFRAPIDPYLVVLAAVALTGLAELITRPVAAQADGPTPVKSLTAG